MSWLQVSLWAEAERVDEAGESLENCGALAVSVCADAGPDVLEPGPGERRLWAANRVTGLFDSMPGLAEDLAGRLAALGFGPPEFELLDDRDWTDAWRQRAEPREFGDGLWIVPHDAQTPHGARAVVRLDPGLAFGTGSHATTALCLDWLAGLDLDGERVIDYGCGSGVLAVAAAKLGAAEVVAIDHDPQALGATFENAALNGVGARVEVTGAEQAAALAPAGVLVANILANPLLELAPTIAAQVRPGGRLGLSGVLAAQAPELARRYGEDFVVAEPRVRDGWVLLEGRRRRPPSPCT